MNVHERITANLARLKQREKDIDDLQAERRAFIRDYDDDPVQIDDKIMRAKQARQACADRTDQLRDLAVMEPSRQWPGTIADKSARHFENARIAAQFENLMRQNPAIPFNEMSAADITAYETAVAENHALEREIVNQGGVL